MSQPLYNAANFVVIDPSASVVNQSIPYSRVVVLPNVNPTSMIITMAVKTGYSDIVRLASVRLNGIEIGKLEPRPWVSHEIIDMEMVTFVVPRNAIPIPFEQVLHQAVMVLQIVPTNADSDNFVLVESVVCHYQIQGFGL